MRDERGKGIWRCQGQEVWYQGNEAGEAENGMTSAVKVGMVGQMEIDGEWHGNVQLVEMNKVRQEVIRPGRLEVTFGRSRGV